MIKFKNKYRIPSARWQSWDYANPGMYFLTICTHDRVHYFGAIQQGEMYLNQLGQIADACWAEIPIHFPNIELGAFVVMPNHIHGIIIVVEQTVSRPINPGYNRRDVACNVSTISPQPGSVSTIIRSYKSAVTRLVRPLQADFAWQTRFHDRIIRDIAEYQRIEHYIRCNPQSWEKDKFFI